MFKNAPFNQDSGQCTLPQQILKTITINIIGNKVQLTE